ncbi:hypothetical protein ACP4OV_006636 [Aristida adscensionis]
MPHSHRLLPWVFVVVFLLCSSRPLAADGDAAKPWAAVGGAGAGGVATTTGRGPGAAAGVRKVWNGRQRFLGNRSPWMPPSPRSGGANGMPAPPPPWV